ncbi:MAG: methyltransferase domain-containing protein [Cytophagales bacterium]|nr:methyltransferase domain-containing protein [Armatimonadota bacterium]
MLTKILGPVINGSPMLKRTLWRRWYQFLARGYTQEDWTFMNYGYGVAASPGDAQYAPPLPLDEADEPDRCAIQLYDRVVGEADLKGKDVAEIGSGRGGGSAYIARSRQPKTMLGIDFSENAVTFSRRRHSAPNLGFEQGDAENLAFGDATFDAILNVESSHCYGSMERFLSEVVRVLRPGGVFLWTDMRPKSEREATRAQFQAAGLTLLSETNITPNVLLGLDQVNDRKRATISRFVPRYLLPWFEDFAGVRGTRVYESLRRGDVEYWRCTLQKPEA